jgi:YD repeat-containing protein
MRPPRIPQCPGRAHYGACHGHALAAIALLIVLWPVIASATIVSSAANLPFSGIAPGPVDMASGELILVMRSDLMLDGPMPLSFTRCYGSMIAREGLASSHLGPNWLGTFDWSLTVGGTGVSVVSNRGQRIQFAQNAQLGYDQVSPTHEKYRLSFSEGMWRFTEPRLRRVYSFDGTSHQLTTISDEHGNSISLIYASGGLLSQVSDGLGRTLSFGYDPSGPLTQVSDGTRSVHFAYSGNLLSAVNDAAGHTTNYSYAVPASYAGLLQAATEPLGNAPMSYSYDALGRVATMTDALGHTSTCSYDTPSGSLWTDALSHTWTFVHDAVGRLTSVLDPANGTTSFTYDALGRLASSTRPLGDVTAFSYDPASGLLGSVTRGDGSVVTYGYTIHGAAGGTFYDVASAGYPDGASESLARDATGNLTNWTDRGGFHWLATYNTRGQTLTATNPAGGVATFTYDSEGLLSSDTDNAGHTTSYAYDGLSRLTQRAWPDGPTQLFAYDNLDHLTSFTDERGKVTTYAYDNDGRLMTTTDPLLAQTGVEYDALDRPIQMSDPLGHTSLMAYDAAGRLASETDRTGNVTQYQYDAVGRVIHVVEPNGSRSTLSYDGNGRLPAVQDALGHTVGFQYDALDRVTHTTDPVGTPADYNYDPMGRLTSMVEPLGRTQGFGYDARGLPTSYFDVTSETDLVRTSLGEIAQLTDPNHNGWPATYDPDGRVTSAADPLARTSSPTYDARDRVTHVQLPLGSEDVVLDAASRVTGVNYSDGTLLSFTYDDGDRLTAASGLTIGYNEDRKITSSNGLTIGRDAEGRITSETYAPGKMVNYAYNSRGLVTSVTDWIGGTTSFGYDTTGALILVLRPDGTSASYQYDAAGRLVILVEGQPGPIQTPLATIAISRDALGRPTFINRSQPLMPAVATSGTTGFAYDAASQIQSDTYDALARMTGDGSRSFQWDGASRLKSYASGAETPQFTYDALDNPLSRTQGATNEQYVWDYARESPTLAVLSQGGSPRTYFIYSPSGRLLHAIDATSGARSFCHYDEDGNTIFLTDDAGAVTTKYAYSPSGVVSTSGPTSSNPFTLRGSSGSIQLGSSGLFRLEGEIYDAKSSRIISGGAVASGGTAFFKSVGGLKIETDPTEYQEGGVHSKSVRPRPPGPPIRGVEGIGDSGPEIATDKNGRVKVRLFWDREGKKDENSSCWIRVSKPWAGMGRGVVNRPRPYPYESVEVDVTDPDLAAHCSNGKHIKDGKIVVRTAAEGTPKVPTTGHGYPHGSGTGMGEGKRSFDEIDIKQKNSSRMLVWRPRPPAVQPTPPSPPSLYEFCPWCVGSGQATNDVNDVNR